MSIVPSTLKTAAIAHVLKKPRTDPTQLSSYRTISNLPFMVKIFEKNVVAQLKDHLDVFNLYEPF